MVSWVLVNQGWGITGVAAASGLSFALVFLMLWGLIMRRGPYTGAEGMGHLVAIMGPFIWAVVMTVSLNMAEPFVGAPEWIGALVKLTLYTVGAYALILVMKRRYPMLRNPLKFKNRG